MCRNHTLEYEGRKRDITAVQKKNHIHFHHQVFFFLKKKSPNKSLLLINQLLSPNRDLAGITEAWSEEAENEALRSCCDSETFMCVSNNFIQAAGLSLH